MRALVGPLLAMALVVVALAVRAPSQEGDAAKDDQEGAKREQYEQMLADKHGKYGAADGGGTARVLQQPDPAPACGGSARYLLEYTAGELGIAAGGAIFLQVSPFWGWSTPQTEEPRAPGYTLVALQGENATGVVLKSETIAPQCLIIRVEGSKLPAGAKIQIDYGAGEAGATVDRFSEAEEAFYFWVDGDGDGTRRLIGSDPHVAIAPGPAVDFVVTAPSEVAVDAQFDVVIAFLDAVANAARGFTGTVSLSGSGLELPESVEFKPEHRARQRVRVKSKSAGVRTVVVRFHDVEQRSNPILVTANPRRILWADLHGHSSLSDGTGTPEDFYSYARDVAALDVAVLTDHDHWGLRKLDQSPELWKRIHDVTARFNEPGRFTTLLGYEWTHWLYGHRHVLYFDGEGEVLSSLDAPTDTPAGLWAALKKKGGKILTVPHHPAGGPVPIDWRIAPDPDFEPVVEITSVHGSSEEPNGPRPIYSAVKGHFVRDALARGYRLGFVGSGDSHNGHPGLVHLGSPCGGLAAILASENSRDAIYAALRARTCYATTGPRILVWFRFGNARMGAKVPATSDSASDPGYVGLAIGTSPIAALQLFKNGKLAAQALGNGTNEQSVEWHDAERASGDVVYLRVLQDDGNAAWASPIFTE